MVDAKKKGRDEEEVDGGGIRLKPSTTDYATYVRRTARALRVTGPLARKERPSKRLLRLARPKS